MSENSRPHADSLSLSAERRIDAVCRRFEAAWRAGEQPSIQAYLDDVPTSERTALLREIIALDLDYRRQAGEAPTLDGYRQWLPDQESLVQELLESAASPLSRGMEKPANNKADSASAPGIDLRYTPVRLHARGGLGEVYVALDQELRRAVALKRIQPRLADDDDSRRRFLQEAEITGRLEHPGIVPVYGLIHDVHGEPAYAMRFVEGATLKEACDHYHGIKLPGLSQQGRDGPVDRSPTERHLAFRQLLGQFVAVCNAVAYAHSRGVIHRDLKPSNILLGKFGETLVVDWGLAKIVGRVEAAKIDGEGTLTTAEPLDSEGTALGHAVGTPAYMSPEQAAGRWNVVGPASDIYSLGAVLYYLLTGQTPYRGQDRFELLAQVQRGGFLRPSQLCKNAPRALEAICIKAMALEPHNRYATAQVLASEVEHWLADEPVTAYREPWWLRLGRWSRQHPVLSTYLGICAGIDLLVIVAAGGDFVWKMEAITAFELSMIGIVAALLANVFAAWVAHLMAIFGASVVFVLKHAAGRMTPVTREASTRGSVQSGAEFCAYLGLLLGYGAAMLIVLADYDPDGEWLGVFSRKLSLWSLGPAIFLPLGGPLLGVTLGLIGVAFQGKLWERIRRAIRYGCTLSLVICTISLGVLAPVRDRQRGQLERKEASRVSSEQAQTVEAIGASYFYFACMYARASAAMKSDAARSDESAADAVEQLQAAHAWNWFEDSANVERLKTDLDLNSLRQRDDFRKLLNEVDKK